MNGARSLILSGTPLIERVGAVVSVGAGAMMEKIAKLSAPDAPPSRPVPEAALSVPKPISTVSPALSSSAVSVSVTEAAAGPVKVTRGLLPVFRFAHATPAALAQATV